MTHAGRIEHLDINDLHHHPRNPRRGDTQKIKDSLQLHGQYKPLVVNRGEHTGGRAIVLAGNHTLEALRAINTDHEEQGTTPPHNTVPCWIVDVDDATATQIMLVDNKTSDDSSYNTTDLIDLLEDLDTLEGTGWNHTELANLADELEQTQIDEEPSEDFNDPYADFHTITLRLAPPLAAQWLSYTTGFDEPEQALEHLLDHGAEASTDR